MTDKADARRALDELFQSEWPRLLGYVAHIVRDLDAAEEIVQEAMIAALQRWPFDGVPDRPGAWLTTTCRNRALNQLRDSARRRQREGAGIEGLTVSDVVDAPHGPLEDDRLRLMFLCCHPALPRVAQVTLTLRLVAGLATPEIARAFLVTEAAMSQRISRAKRAVVEQQLSFEAPGTAELPRRLSAVLDVVYLIFNEGYLPRAGNRLHSVELSAEAHRLAALLTELLPDEPEVWALLALISFQRARAAARTTPEGELVPLEAQDRSCWDSSMLATAGTALAHARAPGARGPLLLQAEIAACHGQAATWEQTDWPRILVLYDELYESQPSPVVALNQAVAVGMVSGPGAALARLDAMPDIRELNDHHLYWATRADLLRRAGDADAALDAYQRALRLTANEVEQGYLRRRIAELQPGAATGANDGGEPHGTR